MKSKNFGKTPLARKYDVIEEIGRGTYGTVYRVERKTDRTSFAIKVTKSLDFECYGEVEILKHLDHPHIIKVHEYRCGRIKKNNSMYRQCEMVLDYFEMDLERFMSERLEKSQTKHSQIRQIMLQLFDALNYLHGLEISHRDLKPKNILIAADKLHVKICDFGLAVKSVRFEKKDIDIQTLSYRAPEVLVGWSQYTKAVDLWSLGCIFVEMFFDQFRRLFPGESKLDKLKSIVSLCGSFSVWFFVRLPQTERLECIRMLKSCGVLDPTNIMDHDIRNQDRSEKLLLFLQDFTSDSDLIDLIGGLLTVTPTKRITAFEALNHSYFKKY